jgi:hypothetical protein
MPPLVRVRMSLVGCCVLAACLSAVSDSPAGQRTQSPTSGSSKTIRVPRTNILNPLIIVRLRFGDNEIPASPSQKISTNEDWLKYLSVVVRNESSKPIVTISLQVFFDGSRVEETVGLYPEHRLFDRHGNKLPQRTGAPISLQPGKELSIAIAPDFEDFSKTIKRKPPLSDVMDCDFYVMDVDFEDGTRWAAGTFYRPDPTIAAAYIPISFQEFSGKTEQEFEREEKRRLNEDERQARGAFVSRYGGGSSAESSESCRDIDPAATQISQVAGAYAVADRGGILFECGPDRATVQNYLDVLQRYAIDRVCSIGSPQTFQYMTVGGSAPSGSIDGEDCMTFDPRQLTVLPSKGFWAVSDGHSLIYSFETEAGAQRAVADIQRYGFTQECYVGRHTYGRPMGCRPIGYLRK